MNKILSIFLREKEFHICAGDFSSIYSVLSIRDFADSCPEFLQNALKESGAQPVDKIIFPFGGASFTTVRIVNSIVKGILVFNDSAKTISVSTFLPYLYALMRHHTYFSEGLIALPTMRGDFFVVNFCSCVITKKNIMSAEEISNCKTNIFYSDDEIFRDVNFAQIQKELVCDDEFLQSNKSFVSDSAEAFYEHSPEYKY